MANKYITEEVFKKSVSDIIQTVADNTYEFEPYSDEEIASAFELSPEEQKSLSEVINDTVYAKNKVYSSEYTLELLDKTKAECNQYTVEQLANSGNLKRKIVSSDSEVIDENILYLILTDSTNNIYTQYMLIDGTATPLGNTQIDLSDYLLIDDFNTTIADYAKKIEVVSQNDVVNDLTTVSSSTVLSSQGTSNELDKKIDKTSISTTIDSTSTDEQVASAKTIYGKLTSMDKECKIVYPSSEFTTLSDYINSLEVDRTYFVRCILDDAPVAEGVKQECVYVIVKHANEYIHVLAHSCLHSTTWERSYVNGSWVENSWKRVCSTSVEDIPKTIINYDTNVFGQGMIFYEVINGICYVTIMALKAKSLVNNYEISSVAMPKPKHGLVTCPIICDGDGSVIGMFYIDVNFGTLPKCHMYDNVKNGYCSFSYSVAES